MKKRLFTIICLITFILSVITPLKVLAIDMEFYSANDILFYNPDADISNLDCSGSTTIIQNSGITSSEKTIRATGITEPYILEQYMIETLKSIAQKKGIDESNAVTEEHVLALVAFAFGEGGDIANSSVFNPFNSGLSDEDLLAGIHMDDGRQSYKSFDAGVEANARVMTGGYQSRMGDILTKKDSTAEQVLWTLTYYKKFAGNKFWASASDKEPLIYYKARLALLKDARRGYEDRAGLIIGTTALEKIDSIFKKENIKYHPVTSKSSLINPNSNQISDGCPSGNNGNINKIALSLAWPNTTHEKTDPKPEYKAAIIEVGLSTYGDQWVKIGASCDAFVTTVMRYSGLDKDFFCCGASRVLTYLLGSNKYKEIPNLGNSSNLQPGDIFSNNGHVMIYIKLPDGTEKMAEASWSKKTAYYANNPYYQWDGEKYHIFRYQGDSSQ